MDADYSFWWVIIARRFAVRETVVIERFFHCSKNLAIGSIGGTEIATGF